MTRWCCVGIPLFLGMSSALQVASWAKPAQDKPNTVALDAKTAGIDFALQGEYVGHSEGRGRLGAQVIAQGNGQFALLFLSGGLPGEGWDGTTKAKATAQRDDDRALISGGGWGGTIADGILDGQGPDGSPFTLHRMTRQSPSNQIKPPPGALVLFDGTSVDEWRGGEFVDRDLLARGTTTHREFRDFTLHLEFRTPFMPLARGQGRGNSGIKFVRIYELQILDSFGLDARNNDCGAIYSRQAPGINMCYPPLSWQTFDVDFRAPRFDADGKKTEEALVTVRHNGILLHDRVALKPTSGQVKLEQDQGPLLLQNHRDPVHFRNIWIVESKQDDGT